MALHVGTDDAWAVETPHNPDETRSTLKELHGKGYEIFSIQPYRDDGREMVLVTAKKTKRKRFFNIF